MNREQLVKALMARKLSTGTQNKTFCICMANAQQKVLCFASTRRSPASKRN
jgi:hypothetical protein